MAEIIFDSDIDRAYRTWDRHAAISYITYALQSLAQIPQEIRHIIHNETDTQGEFLCCFIGAIQEADMMSIRILATSHAPSQKEGEVA